MKRKIYLSYGANTCPDSMARRCPAAVPLGAVTLKDYALVFRGVADIVPMAGSTVHGVLWSITPDCEASLDRFEGFPHLYIKRTVRVRDRLKADFQAMVYIMADHARPSRLAIAPPSQYYYDTLTNGYRAFGLPQRQIEHAVYAAWAVDQEVTDEDLFCAQ